MVTDRLASTRGLWALRRAFHAVEAEKEQRLRPCGLTPALFGVLFHISCRPGLTGADLARALGVTPQNVANLAARLAERGLLERRTNPHHPQGLELHLTDPGTQLLIRADHAIAGLDADLTALLGAADSTTLRALLQRIAAADLSAPTAP